MIFIINFVDVIMGSLFQMKKKPSFTLLFGQVELATDYLAGKFYSAKRDVDFLVNVAVDIKYINGLGNVLVVASCNLLTSENSGL